MTAHRIERRQFIAGFGAGAAGSAWPLAAHAQQGQRSRRIGIMMSTAEGDPEGQARVKALLQKLGDLGWNAESNLQVDVRWGATDAGRSGSYAEDLIKLSPDLLVANATSALAAVQGATKTIPIVFVQVTDPVRGGFVATLARPGGNITGFASFEDTMGAKWPELLKQIAPQTGRALIMHNPAADTGTVKLMPAIQTTAQSLGIELLYAAVRDGPEIEKAFQMVANAPGVGVIPVPDALFTLNRKRLITLAAEQRLPAVYYFRYFAADGGLMSYGPDTIEVYRQAAAYIDRILKGANPGELPVQNPTKYELVLNLKTAKTLGLTVPPQLQVLADEVIE